VDRPNRGKCFFSGWARGFLPNYEDKFLKVGEESKEKGVGSIIFPIFLVLKQFCGTFTGFRVSAHELFLANKRLNKVVFFNQSHIFGLFWEVGRESM
jgi:hypothetical protein